MPRLVKCLPILILFLVFGPGAAWAVNPAHWNIVEQVLRSDTTKTWVSPTPIDLGKMVWLYDFEITKVTGTVNLGIFGDVTQDITSQLPPETLAGAGETRNLPAVLLDDAVSDPESGTSADLLVEITTAGFGRAVFSNIMLGSINVPLFGSRQIERINVEATVDVIGYDFGDFNRDNVVNAADYIVWRNSVGSTGPNLPADGVPDDVINELDFAIWKANFAGASASGLSAGEVPEAAAWLSFLAGSIMLLSAPLRGARRNQPNNVGTVH
jgi:hypothetical protein